MTDMRSRFFGVLVYTGVLVILMQIISLYTGRYNSGGISTQISVGSTSGIITDQPRRSEPPLLTLFTSIKDDASRRGIHNRTLHNWAALRPAVQPVLYVTGREGTDWGVPARALGWSVRYVPRAVSGIPVLKDMFRDAFRSKSTYYGFANSDNLFDRTLEETLRYLSKVKLSTLLVVGRRTNIDVKVIKRDVTDLDYVGSLVMNGSLYKTNAQDYFITTPGGFPWDKVPDFVIGRPGYDNWLVVKSQDWGVKAVDASATIHDLHQTGSDGNMSGWNSTRDLCINRNLVGAFDYYPGHTNCLPYYTARDIAGSITAVRRGAISRECQKHPIKRRKNQPCV